MGNHPPVRGLQVRFRLPEHGPTGLQTGSGFASNPPCGASALDAGFQEPLFGLVLCACESTPGCNRITMKKVLFTASSFLVAVVATAIFHADEERPKSTADQPFLKTIRKPFVIRNCDGDLVERREPPVDLEALGIDPAPFRGETEDSALLYLLCTLLKNPVGEIHALGPCQRELRLQDGRRFAASYIGPIRSLARDGTLALEAVTVPGRALLESVDAVDGRGKTTGSPGEIWLMDSSGKAEKVPLPNIHASRPILSPDARYLAFTAQNFDGESLYPKALMILDRSTHSISSYAERKYGIDYEIAAVDWVEEGQVLRVIDDWGETGGHLKLKEVRIR